MAPESLVHGHRSTIIQTSPGVLHMESDHIQYTIIDIRFLEFPLSMALLHVGSEVVLSQSSNKGCILIPKVVEVALVLLEAMGHVTVSAL